MEIEVRFVSAEAFVQLLPLLLLIQCLIAVLTEVCLGNQVLLVWRGDIIIGVLLEEGHGVVDLDLIRVRQCLRIFGIPDELCMRRGVPSAVV